MAKIEAFLGKEEGAHRLEVKVGQKSFAVGSPESVPKSVSRSHCLLTVEFSDDAKRTVKSIIIKNVKIQNTTYVDGLEIEQKAIKENSLVQLGFERYKLDVPAIVAKLRLLLPEIKIEYSILPLKNVWEEYDRTKLAITTSSVKSANRQRLQGILSMFGMLVGFIPGVPTTFRVVIIGAALVMAVYFFVKGSVGDPVHKRLHDLDEDFRKRYVCPNPECHHYLGQTPYDVLRQNKSCGYCKCKYYE